MSVEEIGKKTAAGFAITSQMPMQQNRFNPFKGDGMRSPMDDPQGRIMVPVPDRTEDQ